MDYLDIPDLQRRGFIKKIKEKEPLLNKPFHNTNSDGYVNLGSQNTTQPQESTSPQPSSSPLDFLDSLAGAGSSSTETESQTTSTFQNLPPATSDMQDFIVKLDDFQYKLDRLMDRLATIESKIADFESKVT